MNEDSYSFMIVFQCNAFVYDCECSYLLFFALRALRLKILIFELEAIPLRYRLLEPRMNRLSNVAQTLG